jgi:ABC-type phosphonate transport system ATPase subunit
MSNLEHLIENTLMAMEDNTLCNKDIRERIKNDVNLPYTSLSVDDVLEICAYFLYTWCGTCEK